MNQSVATKPASQRNTMFPTADLSAAATLLDLAELYTSKPARAAYRSAIEHYTRALNRFEADRSANRMSDMQAAHIEGKLIELEQRISALERQRSAPD